MMILGTCSEGKVYYTNLKISAPGNYTLRASAPSSSALANITVLPQILRSIELNPSTKFPSSLFRFTIIANLFDEDGDPFIAAYSLSLSSNPQISGVALATSYTNIFRFSVIAQAPGYYNFFSSLLNVTANLTLNILPNVILIKSTILSNIVSII